MQSIQMVEAQEGDLPDAQGTSCVEVISAGDGQNCGTGDGEEPDMKKIKLEEEDESSVYVLTVSGMLIMHCVCVCTYTHTLYILSTVGKFFTWMLLTQ